MFSERQIVEPATPASGAPIASDVPIPPAMTVELWQRAVERAEAAAVEHERRALALRSAASAIRHMLTAQRREHEGTTGTPAASTRHVSPTHDDDDASD